MWRRYKHHPGKTQYYDFVADILRVGPVIQKQNTVNILSLCTVKWARSWQNRVDQNQSAEGVVWSGLRSTLFAILMHDSAVKPYGPRQANLVLIAYASSEGSGEPAYSRSLARTSAARSCRQWVKRNLQTESQIPSPSEWLGMRS